MHVLGISLVLISFFSVSFGELCTYRTPSTWSYYTYISTNYIAYKYCDNCCYSTYLTTNYGTKDVCCYGDSDSDSKKLSTGAIVGIVIGGVAIIGICIISNIVCKKKKPVHPSVQSGNNNQPQRITVAEYPGSFNQTNQASSQNPAGVNQTYPWPPQYPGGVNQTYPWPPQYPGGVNQTYLSSPPYEANGNPADQATPQYPGSVNSTGHLASQTDSANDPNPQHTGNVNK